MIKDDTLIQICGIIGLTLVLLMLIIKTLINGDSPDETEDEEFLEYDNTTLDYHVPQPATWSTTTISSRKKYNKKLRKKYIPRYVMRKRYGRN
jgi:hypothetical protein